MPFASIGPIAVCLPEAFEDNDYLAATYPKWDMELIYRKTGIRRRHIAAVGQCASDLGVAAAERLFDEQRIDRGSIDFLLLCTQSPDYLLPTTACLMQDRLGLRTSCGALDFNLGCSGFVYGLSLADGLIRSGAARRLLLVTAETYSKYIDPGDRSLRTIFGDGAAATLIEAADEPSIGSFVFGTDGRGAGSLIVTEGGARPKADAIQPTKRKRWPSSLFMDGPELVNFTLEVVPPMVERLLAEARWSADDVDMYLMHQATTFMLEHLRTRMRLKPSDIPLALEEYGNTVSSTLPILIRDLRRSGQLTAGKKTLMIGFGVGLSWAGCSWTETYAATEAAKAVGGAQAAHRTAAESDGRAHASAARALPATTVPATAVPAAATPVDRNGESLCEVRCPKAHAERPNGGGQRAADEPPRPTAANTTARS